MRRTVLLVLFAFVPVTLPLPGSEAKVLEIRERYRAISQKIEHEELLHHEIVFKTLVPGIGLQFTTMRCYYEFLQDGETGEVLESPLIKVTLDYMIAASVSFYIEYVFDEAEEVIFYYLRAEGAECGERRFYFDDEKLIKVKSNSLGEACNEGDAGYIYEEYEKTKQFNAEDYARGKQIVKKAAAYTAFFHEMGKVEQVDK